MLRLKNVSKFYYNKGVVASGFSKINLNLNMGEFVVITGESGSGKSTLLNVISGLDSYEEGEMYINGEETSYYSDNDFEEYRKKYIANIFQNFNLVNSYTVYQNIELIYLVNNLDKTNMKEEINVLIEKVGLTKYKNTKAAKLSGGQKQRVAIARALAKNTPIIVADEPTGNLDSKSANEIIELLYSLSKEKLVIIVTHNYEQVEKYATRRIKMYDGRILEDTTITHVDKDNEYKETNFGVLTLKDKFRLSLRNTFNVIPKFLLLLIVYSFLTLAVISVYTASKNSNYEDSNLGFNKFFNDLSDSRIIIKKKDLSEIEEDDYNKISNIKNVNYIIKKDLLLDTKFSLSNDNVYLWGNVANLTKFNDNLDEGIIPEKQGEIVLKIPKNSYYNNQGLLNKSLKLEIENSVGSVLTYDLKITGIKYIEDSNYSDDVTFYLIENDIDNISKSINRLYSDINISIDNIDLESEQNSRYNTIYPSSKVKKNEAIISEQLNNNCDNFKCNNLIVNVSNIYYKDKIKLNIVKSYSKDNIEELTGYDNYDSYVGYIFINEDDYYSLFNKGNYQSSVFVKNVKNVKSTIKELNNMGYSTLYVKDTTVDLLQDVRVFVNLFKAIALVIALVALFFISYFIIKIILKSRNIYFSIIRMLGCSKKDVKMLINIELNTILNISYLLILVIIILVNNKIIDFPYLNKLVDYLKFSDYIILYGILFIISLIISLKFGKSIFKKSAIKTFNEEV